MVRQKHGSGCSVIRVVAPSQIDFKAAVHGECSDALWSIKTYTNAALFELVVLQSEMVKQFGFILSATLTGSRAWLCQSW